MRQLKGILGNLKVVTVTEFLSLVPRHVYGPGNTHIQFNTMVSDFGFSSDSNEEVATYKRKVVPILPGGPHEKTSLRWSLMGQLESVSVYRQDLVDLAYDMIQKHKERLGTPTHLVRISKRLWMVANPDDFRVAVNDRGVAALSLFEHRSVAINIIKV